MASDFGMPNGNMMEKLLHLNSSAGDQMEF